MGQKLFLSLAVFAIAGAVTGFAVTKGSAAYRTFPHCEYLKDPLDAKKHNQWALEHCQDKYGEEASDTCYKVFWCPEE